MSLRKILLVYCHHWNSVGNRTAELQLQACLVVWNISADTNMLSSVINLLSRRLATWPSRPVFFSAPPLCRLLAWGTSPDFFVFVLSNGSESTFFLMVRFVGGCGCRDGIRARIICKFKMFQKFGSSPCIELGIDHKFTNREPLEV